MAAFLSELERVFAQAEITLRINGIERLTGTAFERITDFNEPQESPTSQSAMVPGLVADRVTDASTCSSSRVSPRASPGCRSNAGPSAPRQLLLRRAGAR